MQQKVYLSSASKKSIHRPAILISIMVDGAPAYRQFGQPPIEFRDGKLKTSDPAVQKRIEEDPEFGEQLGKGTKAGRPCTMMLEPPVLTDAPDNPDEGAEETQTPEE